MSTGNRPLFARQFRCRAQVSGNSIKSVIINRSHVGAIDTAILVNITGNKCITAIEKYIKISTINIGRISIGLVDGV